MIPWILECGKSYVFYRYRSSKESSAWSYLNESKEKSRLSLCGCIRWSRNPFRKPFQLIKPLVQQSKSVIYANDDHSLDGLCLRWLISLAPVSAWLCTHTPHQIPGGIRGKESGIPRYFFFADPCEKRKWMSALPLMVYQNWASKRVRLLLFFALLFLFALP